MIDLIIHAGTKLALEQWLDARGLGDLVQDTEPTSPTFGDYVYHPNLEKCLFYYWRHPSGKLEATGGETPTLFSGFYATLSFRGQGIPEELQTWAESSTAVSILDGFNGVGGEGVTFVNPEDVNAHCESIGVPGHILAGGMLWSDPALWAFASVMIDDEREFDGTKYRSLIDFNVWTPTQYPGGWEAVEDETPEVPDWVQPTGGHDAYQTGDEVMFNGTHYRSTIDNNVWSPVAYPAGWEVVT